MGIKLTKGKIIFCDTAPFIYFFEKNEQYLKKMKILFDEIYEKEIQVIVSMITYIEIITFPLREGRNDIAAKYRDFFTNSENISVYPVTIYIAEMTAYFRAQYNFKTPDAIQLATAKNCGVDYVITNDKEWKKTTDMEIILLDEL